MSTVEQEEGRVCYNNEQPFLYASPSWVGTAIQTRCLHRLITRHWSCDSAGRTRCHSEDAMSVQSSRNGWLAVERLTYERSA